MMGFDRIEAVSLTDQFVQKIEAMIHLGGYALLFGFMIFFTFKDVMRIFQ